MWVLVVSYLRLQGSYIRMRVAWVFLRMSRLNVELIVRGMATQRMWERSLWFGVSWVVAGMLRWGNVVGDMLSILLPLVAPILAWLAYEVLWGIWHRAIWSW